MPLVASAPPDASANEIVGPGAVETENAIVSGLYGVRSQVLLVRVSAGVESVATLHREAGTWKIG